MKKEPNKEKVQAESKPKPGRNGNFPPIEKGFKKGQSGNPAGRAKGSKNRSTILTQIFESVITSENPLTKKKEKMSIEAAMAYSMIDQVIKKGNVTAWNSAKDDVYGKAKESVELSGDILNILTPPTMSFEEWEQKTQPKK